MKIYHFGPLETVADIRARFFRRLLWSGLGLAIGTPFLIYRGHELGTVFIYSFVIIMIPVAGGFADAYRLKNPEVPVARLRRVALPITFVVLGFLILSTIYFFR